MYNKLKFNKIKINSILWKQNCKTNRSVSRFSLQGLKKRSKLENYYRSYQEATRN